jgi:hypothetical protein
MKSSRLFINVRFVFGGHHLNHHQMSENGMSIRAITKLPPGQQPIRATPQRTTVSEDFSARAAQV